MSQAVHGLLCQLKCLPVAGASSTALGEAKVKLQQWLHGRRMLVVLDDVWDQRIPELFQNADCQLLVTAQQCTVWPNASETVNLTPQMVHDSGVAADILNAHNKSSRELVSTVISQ